MIKGKCFKIDGHKLTIFNLVCSTDNGACIFEGDVMSSRESEADQFRPDRFSPVAVSKILKEAISRATSSGQQIHQVIINNNTAAFLWCEGVLTEQHFQLATEDNDTVCLSIQFADQPSYQYLIRHYLQMPDGYQIIGK